MATTAHACILSPLHLSRGLEEVSDVETGCHSAESGASHTLRCPRSKPAPAGSQGERGRVDQGRGAHLLPQTGAGHLSGSVDLNFCSTLAHQLPALQAAEAAHEQLRAHLARARHRACDQAGNRNHKHQTLHTAHSCNCMCAAWSACLTQEGLGQALHPPDEDIVERSP